MEEITESGFIDQPPEKLPGQAPALGPCQQLRGALIPWMQMIGHSEGQDKGLLPGSTQAW